MSSQEDVKEFSYDVLAFSPHPDDVELFCGGTLLKLTRMGYQTAVVDLTRGELSSQGTPEIRTQEVSAATEKLGLAHRENLALPDGDIGGGFSRSEEQCPNAQLETIVETIRRLRPEIILIPPKETRHPDHSAAYELLRKGIFNAGIRKFVTKNQLSAFSPRQVLCYQMRVEFRPSFIVDISDFLEEKQEVIRCYQSQVVREEQAPQKAGNTKTLVSSPLSIDSIVSRDKYYGSMIGTVAGEAFFLHNTIALSDPVKHFRDNPGNEALNFPSSR